MANKNVNDSKIKTHILTKKVQLIVDTDRFDTDDTAFNNIEKSSDIKPTKSNSNKSSKKSLIKTNEVVINKKNINDVITTDNIENTNTVEDMEEIETDDNDLLSILKSVKG